MAHLYHICMYTGFHFSDAINASKIRVSILHVISCFVGIYPFLAFLLFLHYEDNKKPSVVGTTAL